MNTYTKEVGEKLNALLEKTYDAEKGFTKAAEIVKNESLKKYFTQKATERNTFGQDLKKEISSFNQGIDKGGSLVGTVHRAWMDVKSLFSLDDVESMLEEAIRGEKASIEEYDDVLKEIDLPSSTKDVLAVQKNIIENGLYNIKSLEERL
ncbi:ferritin-like domain-containing protein [Polaribacter sp. IC073]|uniref:ferritin-like domain-containing protein n=1 Tax=Polaribacter sp. IC073 TaxID=2508540 RepID=UPI0011BFE42F|nr:PA2169 family four-helix-bundle protein [Polaribacter sp. IC073]TXD48206.1 PA2169 family four-helix-bundle protein [Polaribacter sp. IC073]